MRDIPSGLLRIGHDRFLPGLKQLVETVREASDGRTKLFIQIIDFLAVKRRPERTKFFDRFLAITTRQTIAGITSASYWLKADESQLREFLQAADDDILDQILDARELESLRFGYRERVTDADCPHASCRVLEIFASAASRARSRI